MTDKEQTELDGILETLYNIGRHKEAGGLTDKPLAMSEARQALLDWRDKAIAQSMAKFGLKKGKEYAVTRSDSVIVIRPSQRLAEKRGGEIFHPKGPSV